MVVIHRLVCMWMGFVSKLEVYGVYDLSGRWWDAGTQQPKMTSVFPSIDIRVIMWPISVAYLGWEFFYSLFTQFGFRDSCYTTSYITLLERSEGLFL